MGHALRSHAARAARRSRVGSAACSASRRNSTATHSSTALENADSVPTAPNVIALSG